MLNRAMAALLVWLFVASDRPQNLPEAYRLNVVRYTCA